jgi:hypothetical protein
MGMGYGFYGGHWLWVGTGVFRGEGWIYYIERYGKYGLDEWYQGVPFGFIKRVIYRVWTMLNLVWGNYHGTDGATEFPTST